MKTVWIAAVAMAAVAGLAAGGVAVAQTPTAKTFSVEARSSGETPPLRVWVEVPPGPDVTLPPSGGVYAARVPGAESRSVRRALLMADYPDGPASLPIRLVPRRPDMQLGIQRARLVPCTAANVQRFESPGPGQQAQLAAYFGARRLAEARTCGASMQARVVKAWFDRSYGLADSNDHIALDEDATRALMAYPAHRAYAEMMQRRMDTKLTALDYAYQMALASDGEYAAAVEVNEALTARLAESVVLTADAAAFQGLTEDRLAQDNSLLVARAAAVSDAAAAGPE